MFVEDGDAVTHGTHFGDFGVTDGGIFEGADFFGGGVAQGFELFDFKQQGPALFVEAQHDIDQLGFDPRPG